jgi:N-acetylglucosamine-6-phosphate deacetylase
MTISVAKRFLPRLYPQRAINIRKNYGGRPVFFDPHVNGYHNKKAGVNCDFWNAPSDRDIEKFCRYQFKKGILAFYPTLITSSIEDFEKNLQRIHQYTKRNNLSQAQANRYGLSHIRGVHIEGGLISKPGVHPQEHMGVFKDFENVKKLVEKYPGLIKMWTLCPTQDPEGKITKYLQEQGILVSYGHSSATYTQAQQAFEKYKVNTVTHWGNTMFLHKDIKDARTITPEQIDLIMDPTSVSKSKNPDNFGIGYAALHNPNVTLQVICGSERAKDLHLNPELLRKVIAYKGPKKIALVSDVACNPRRPDTLRGANQLLHKHYKNLQALMAQPDRSNKKT